jgi:hypothetical protein
LVFVFADRLAFLAVDFFASTVFFLVAMSLIFENQYFNYITIDLNFSTFG